MEKVRYTTCDLFRGLKKNSNLQLLLQKISITKTFCADMFKAPKHEITYREDIQILKSKKRLLNQDYPAENARNNVRIMSLENEITEVRDG